MFEMIIDDVSGIFRTTFLNGDWVSLVIAFGSVLVASLVMQRLTQIGSMTLLALTFFVIGGYLRGVLRNTAPETATDTGSVAVNRMEASWVQFMDMQAGTLLAYFLAFMLLIVMIFGLKSVISRG